MSRVTEQRLPPEIEAAAYFVIAEALTNATRYAAANSVRVAATIESGALIVTISDDGRGGADLASGSGLQGLADRIAAVGGTLSVESPVGAGTTVRAHIPIDDGR